MPNSTLQRILYIEDDEGLARLLQKRLERYHFDVATAFTAEEGLERLKNERYDLVLLDHHLPGMNGLEALDVIMAMEGPPPVILLAASGDEHVAVAAWEKGAADYAVKDAGQGYFDLLPAIMQAAYIRERLLRENEQQRLDLKEAKEKAESANQAKTNFLATMSHEIRTPLNVVTGLTSLLAKTKLNEEQTRIVKTLSSNADLLLKLINDLLDISRIEAGHVLLESTRFEFSSVLDDIKAMFHEHARHKNVNFTLTDATKGSSYIGDRTRVQQIVMNLVSNAIKFTESGEVDVITEFVQRADAPPCIRLTVRDTGIGIAPEYLPNIFGKFTQADETITRRYGGSGLGLSIAHSLAKMMEGEITVQSEPGKGSIFIATICLQHCHGEDGGACEIEATPSAEQSPGGTILLVEDYAPNVMVASMMLEDLGFSVVAAASGAEAIQAVFESGLTFLAILMDVQMQGMDGLETTQRIRQLEKEKGIRHTIIGVTAHALAGDRERCISGGMDDYISKPIHPDILAAKLRSLVSAKA